MPICTSCTKYVPFLYTVYESAYNLRLEECTKCHAFADPYVEHDSLTLLLDLVLLKRGVYRHLLYNRGSEPRKAFSNGKNVDPEERSPVRGRRRRIPGKRAKTKPWVDAREMRRWSLVFKLGIVFIFLDAYIRWCHLNPNPPSAGSPWTLDLFAHFSRVLLGCVVETVAFHSSIGFMCLISFACLNISSSSTSPTSPSTEPDPNIDIRREFRISLVPLTLFYSSLTKLLLLWLLTIWRPSTTSIPSPSFRSSFLRSNSLFITPWREYILKAFVALDDDKIDKEWFIRNILGGMSAGFGLRMILDTHPLVTTLIIVIGWAFKTLVATMVSHWVGGSERSGDAWLAYSIP
ncbi:Arv1-like family domain containing protein [Amanita muscaria]